MGNYETLLISLQALCVDSVLPWAVGRLGPLLSQGHSFITVYHHRGHHTKHLLQSAQLELSLRHEGLLRAEGTRMNV